jgi:putative two-component system response regulator
MKKHPVYGARMLENAESRLLHLARNIALAHHEHWDGTGYPHGLKGEQIPLEARIVTVVDVFDALTTRRVYKGAWSVEDTFRYMLEQSGRLFDPGVIGAFVKCRPQVEEMMLSSHPDGEDEESGALV